MTKQAKRRFPSLPERERTARAAIARRLAEEAQADGERRRARTADVAARMTALSNRRAQRDAALRRAEDFRMVNRRLFRADRERNRLSLVGDLIIGIHDVLPEELVRL